MEERFIVTTYDPLILAAHKNNPLYSTAYYQGGVTYGFDKHKAKLFDSYEEAKMAVFKLQANCSQIEKVFVIPSEIEPRIDGDS